MDFTQIAKNAKEASLKIADLSTEIKNKALIKIADKIESAKDEIFEANKIDLELAQKLGMKKLTIFHDYEGIAAWVLGKWKCKKPETRRYAMVMWKAMDAGLRIYFNHVKGHSGNWGNDEADQLAKLAVGLEVK